MTSPSLDGVRVIDLTRLLPGPLATRYFADLGAEVIKVEPPDGGDYARGLGPAPAGGEAWLFRICNGNKRSLALDLKHPRGRALLLELAGRADVLVEGFRPGVMERLGLAYETMRKHNPRLVYCSITGYGHTGPWRERAGHDLNYIATAGVLDQIGGTGGDPAVPNLQIGDLLGGTLSAVMGVLAGVIGARATGQGRFVDVAMADCTLAHNLFPLIALLDRGQTAARGEDLLTGGVPCYGVYRTADGRHMAVGALEGKFWQAFCSAVDRPHWVQRQFDPDLREQVAALFRERTREAWAAQLGNVDCCVTPVLDTAETLEHEQFRARNMVRRDAEGSPAWAFPIPGLGSDGDARPAPALGAHTGEILQTLGVDAEARAILAGNGIIGGCI